MKFKYSAIGRNTKENREWLESINRKPFVNWLKDENYEGYHIVCLNDNYHLTTIIPDNESYVNCINNPQLFQAVTAISTTTDIGKHYINNHTGQCKRCDYNMATDENIDWNDWSEATISELIAHF